MSEADARARGSCQSLHTVGFQDTNRAWILANRREATRGNSADRHDLSGQDRGVSGSRVPSGPHDLHVTETGLPEFITESDRLLRAGHSREPVCRARARGACQGGLQDQLGSEDRTLWFEDPGKLVEDLVTIGIQVKEAVDQDVID